MRPLFENQVIARQLAQQLASFHPTLVVGIARGGARLGALVAQELEVPFRVLDVAYPASRPWLGRLGEAVLFPLKEMLYRLSCPTLHGELVPFAQNDFAALVDDTASSGRTLTVALHALAQVGMDRSRVVVAVGRCGQKAKVLVDVYSHSRGKRRQKKVTPSCEPISIEPLRARADSPAR
ncbi:MAG: phosphoribosyltransferase domain-containing protein [Myxococcota bacterium]|jgi:predicted phosphoribosyltransferase|nr:phosphoribosyltransferase domain-containing protein [Myxococcota bacterium]